MRPEHYIKQHMLDRRNGIDRDYTIPDTTIWHKPTVQPRYKPALPSKGNRKPAPKSPLNYRGTQPNLDGERIMYFESGVELKAGRILRASPLVTELREQWPTIRYRGADRKWHTHTIDLWTLDHNNVRTIIAAKPWQVLVKTGTLDILRRIRAQGFSEYADRISLVTEAFANDDDNANAEWILLSRENRNDEEYLLAKSILTRMVGNTVRFWDLLRSAPIEAHRRTAVWNLIDDGVLSPASPGRITDTSLLIVRAN
ncbi:hypothetical protein ELH66_08100 [Rhizobium ruizarguesonis]|uniref:hypothetical protein n=1 Tax=Rhizobium ruizarguesonis TaxID=2081791 RepID=UPI001030BFA7|nr:hypothetical protein [Rhizobium ruizarguesonis]TBA20961.1 hypothetical protein ELH66_08100 [Rhizobium ruizarguesonis]